MKILKADFNGSSFHRVYFIGISFSFSYADRIIIRFFSAAGSKFLRNIWFRTINRGAFDFARCALHVHSVASTEKNFSQGKFATFQEWHRDMKIPDILYSGLACSLSLSLFSFSASSPGASILIGLPLAFPYPHTSTHTNNTYTSPPLCARRYSTLITYFCISCHCSRNHTFSAKGRKIETKSLENERMNGIGEMTPELLFLFQQYHRVLPFNETNVEICSC